MKVIFSLDAYEVEFILNAIKRESKKLKGHSNPGIKNLIQKFEVGRETHMDLVSDGYQEISDRAKKARKEYERIFFERYGTK